MTTTEKGICVRILGKEFRVACAKGQERDLRDAAHYLDAQMHAIRQTGRIVGMERIAIMAALNLANSLLTLQKPSSQPETAFFERIQALDEKMEAVLAMRKELTQRKPEHANHEQVYPIQDCNEQYEDHAPENAYLKALQKSYATETEC